MLPDNWLRLRLYPVSNHPRAELGQPARHAGCSRRVTAATLYQRTFAPRSDLKAAAVIQLPPRFLVLAPLGVVFEGFRISFSWPLLGSIAFLVIFASILGVNVLHLLMRRGEATRVTSMMYLPPVFAVVLEFALFGVVPSGLSFLGMAVTCAGVAMTVWKGRWRSSISSR